MNPAELIRPFASKIQREGKLTGTDGLEFDIEPVDQLNELGNALNLLQQQYVVRGQRVMALQSEEFWRGEPKRLDGIDFTGELVAYNAVNSPRAFGSRAINGLCLTFENVTLLPFEERQDGIHLHITPFEVVSIERHVA